MSTSAQSVRELQPNSLWNHFANLNEVPRASKKEERVIQFAKEFGESLGLETLVDETGNVIIRKPATPGREKDPGVVLQAHLDMVHQKNAETQFDFETQGIRMLVDGDWVRAEGTTLGADNGIGVAAIMAVLSSDEISHPPLDALFTIDEETGMTGAKGLKGGLLQGSILLNLDTEEDNELTIGCAGGVDILVNGSYTPVQLKSENTCVQLVVGGLTGGHSGMDIHLGRGNANRLMNRLLSNATREFGIAIHSIDGGGLRNAIPRESVAIVAFPTSKEQEFQKWFEQQSDLYSQEYSLTDPDLKLDMEASSEVSGFLDADTQKRLLGTVGACPDGIERMSPAIPELVQTSNNLARVSVQDGKIEIGCLTRSNVNSERDYLANRIKDLFELLKPDEAVFRGRYPGWKPEPESMIVKLMSELYQEQFSEPAHVAACHAGLECGILGTHYPDMQMISFGPNIRGAHSPDERVQISSVQKFWGYFLATLERIR